MKRKKVLYILAAVAMAILAAADVFFILVISNLIAYDKREKDRNNGFHYISIQHESSPMKKEVEDFQEIYDFLKDSGDRYYEMYAQSLGAEEGSFFDYGGRGLMTVKSGQHTQGMNVSALQVSRNVLEDHHIETEEGRSLAGEDFVYHPGKRIPVLMGSAYKDIYHIGDTFWAEYLFDQYEFEIIGFLKEGAATDWGIGLYWLDEYIIMPSFSITEETEVTDGIRVHYANKTSGVLKIPEEEQERFEKDYRPVLENNRAGDYSWSISPISAGYQSLIGVDIYLLRNLAYLLLAGLTVGEIAVLYQIRQIRRLQSTGRNKAL